MKEKRTKPRFDVCLTARRESCVTNRDIRISDLSQGNPDSLVSPDKRQEPRRVF